MNLDLSQGSQNNTVYVVVFQISTDNKKEQKGSIVQTKKILANVAWQNKRHPKNIKLNRIPTNFSF